MRRLTVGLSAFVVVTGSVLALPVYSEPRPEPRPVHTSTAEIAMGSVSRPSTDARVERGTTAPITGVPEDAPALTVSRSDVSFSLVGVTWAHDPEVTDTVVHARVRDGGGAWGDWTEVSPEDAGQDAGAGAPARSGTAPLWTGPSTGVEVELVTRAGAQPSDVRLNLVDPGTSPADASLGAPDIQDTAEAARSMPDVYSRSQWGADEGIRTWDPSYASTMKAATVHHTADTNNYTADQVPAMMRSIYRYHSVSLGWGDIGYNVIVDKFGRLWEGRAGGLSSTVIGAHAGGFNTGTFGVSMLGNYDVVQPTGSMVESVAAIIAWKFSLYGVDPRGTTTLTSGGGGTARYAAGTSVTVPTIFGHRDVGNTACPGRYGYAQMGTIRARAAELVGSFESPIDAYYNSNPAVRAGIGEPVTPLRGAADGQGLYRDYQRGSVYWSHASGAHSTSGAIRDLFYAKGGVRGSLGYPRGEMACGLAGDGCRQEFQGGTVIWTAGTGARSTNGAIAAAWVASGGESGPLGYPSEEMGCGLPGPGCGQQFQGGSVYWSAASGAHAVSGRLWQYWTANGWERGPLGYATSAMVCSSGGSVCRQDFQGQTVFALEGSGVVTTSGAIRDRWRRDGAEGGWLGRPVQAMTCGATGCRQEFQGGTVTWSEATGARRTNGAIAAAWVASGRESGPLGFPSAEMGCNLPGPGCGQQFEHGSLYWTAATGAHPVTGPIWEYWTANGWERGSLGYATADMTCDSARARCTQQFQGGTLTWSASTGTVTRTSR